MPAELTDSDGQETVALDRPSLERLRGREAFFWLDLLRPEAREVELVGDVFGFHPLVVEDATQFDKRPRLDGYDGYVFLVTYGAATGEEDLLVEVHVFFCERFLITVRREESDAFGNLRERIARRSYRFEHPIAVLYHLVDELTSSFFPVLDWVDQLIDRLGDGILERPTDEQLQQMFTLKRRLVGLRRVIAPQRDLFATLSADASSLPAMTAGAERYFRDLYDHLIRLADSIDGYRDLLTSTMDVYVSTVSNRLNAVMKQLTVIATIFLPITFVTGFFGQNFGWMVDRVGGLAAFAGLGLGLQLLTVAGLLVLFRRRGWF